MLTGKELGAAIREAIRLKGVRRVEVADAFGVKPPSIQDWMNFGRIDKKHIEKLVKYFSDVVPASHWGFGELSGGAFAANVKPGLADQTTPDCQLIAAAMHTIQQGRVSSYLVESFYLTARAIVATNENIAHSKTMHQNSVPYTVITAPKKKRATG